MEGHKNVSVYLKRYYEKCNGFWQRKNKAKQSRSAWEGNLDRPSPSQRNEANNNANLKNKANFALYATQGRMEKEKKYSQ